MVRPKITVITPSFNQGAYIGETIESVLRQKYENLEFFVIDGLSTDDTADVVGRYASSITSFVSERDTGQAEAINKGFRRATGEIVCWLNSDDLFEPGALNFVAEEYRRRPFSFLYGDGWVLRNASHRRRIRPGAVTKERLLVRDPILQPSAFWTREVLDAVGGLDETLHYVLDWDFFIRISQRFALTYCRAELSTYRIHPSHKSSFGGKRRAEEIMTVIRKYSPPEWQDAFEDLWSHYDEVDADVKLRRVLRAALLYARHPGLLTQHGPARISTAILTLL